MRIEQVALDQADPVREMADALDVLRRRAARHPEHLVAFLEQDLGEVGAVLPRDSRDQRAPIRHRAPPYMRVGISLLTLVPGVVGGSETYARELARALERVGEHEYRVFAPSTSRDDGGLCPGRPASARAAAR